MKTKIFLFATFIFLYAFQNALNAQTLSCDIQINGVSYSTYSLCVGEDITLNGTPSGGIAPYTYLWSGGGSQLSSTNNNPTVFTATTPGAYTISYTVTDAATNTAIDTLAITVLPPPTPFISPSQSTICLGTCVMLTGSGGGTYLWSNGSNTVSVTVCPVVTTTYTVTVVNANGCSSTANTTVFVNGVLNVSATSTNASCSLCNGSVSLNASGGTPPYSYLWSTSATGAVITNLCAGTYSVTISDAIGCTATNAVTIMGSQGVSVVLDSLVNANCSNNSLGFITVHGDCGTAPYNYQWSTGQTTATINNLVPGVYTVSVIDAMSDTAITDFTISSTANIYASVSTTNANCSNNGSATVNVVGLMPPFSYEWSDPLHQTTATANGLAQGTYYVTITDSIGCSLIASAYIYSGCMNVIKGRVYLDTNQNCVQDAGEPGVSNKVLYTSLGYYYGVTDSNGDFTIQTPFSNVTLYTPYMQMPYALNCPVSGSYNINFTIQGDTSFGNDFAYYADPDYVDLIVNAAEQAARPGFTRKSWIYYYNNSFSPQNVMVRLTYDSLLQFDSCHQGGIHYPADHKIEWTINNVPPGINYYWQNLLEVYFYVPPSLNLGTWLYSCYEIFPIAGDANPANNTYCTERKVTNSWDPNSKEVSPAGVSQNGFITTNDSILNYTIHFQNTGTDTAFTIVVVDTLSPYLDPATVEPGAASHPYTFTMTGQGVMTFHFNNILLPDSNVNEPASNGYVSYSVKQKKNNPDGTIILNTAWNYFDFNPPVSTNTTVSTLDYHLFVAEDIATQNNINIFPNPFRNAFNIEIKGSENYPFRLRIYNSLSNIVMAKVLMQPTTSISALSLREGIYFISVEDKNGNVIGKGKIIKQ